MPLGLPFANKHTLARSGGLIDDNFLCPNLEQDIHVQGSYFDAEFSYIRLRVLGCNEQNDEFECANSATLAKKKSLRLHLPESSINFENHEHSNAL